MGALYYALITLLTFCFLVWNNKRKSEHWDDVICMFYVVFSVLWMFYLPVIFIIKCFEGIAKGIRNDLQAKQKAKELETNKDNSNETLDKCSSFIVEKHKVI